jgi:hypothetical protein
MPSRLGITIGRNGPSPLSRPRDYAILSMGLARRPLKTGDSSYFCPTMSVWKIGTAPMFSKRKGYFYACCSH